jgi:hypothetical protein
MATSRFNADAPSVQTDARAGFGRGSAVREYWLERCQGFSAVATDGRRLGRVKRVEVRVEGTFLRLTGMRAREIPVGAIETVWPSAAVLTISADGADAGSRPAMREERRSKRPAWEDETLPWWELFADGVRSDRSRTRPSRGRRLVSIVASPRPPLERKARAVALRVRRLGERARTLTKTLVDEAVRSCARISGAARSAAVRAGRAFARTMRRARRGLARILFGAAVWIAGSREALVDPDPQDRSVCLDDEDTAEIASYD